MTLPNDAPMVPAAELNRRFYAFVIDRVIGWGLCAGAAYLAWVFFFDRDRLWPGIGVILAAVLTVGLVAALLTGLAGATPGKLVTGLRVVHHGTGTPIGVGRALLRTLILGVSTLPTFGLGVATLAWTALADPGRQRRGWHDRVSHSIVVDVRHRPEPVSEDADGPRHIVNLTALRLLPAEAPNRQAAPQPQPAAAAPAPPATSRPTAPAQPPPPGQPPAQPSGAPAWAGQPAVAAHPAPQPRHSGPPTAPPSGPPTAPPGGPPTPPPAAGPVDGVSGTVARGAPNLNQRYVWRVEFDTGESLIVTGLGLIGRRPEASPGEPVAHLIPLASSDMSVSKTHAQFHLANDGVLVVMDRGSTNGSVLLRQGASRDLRPGRPATLLHGDRVRFGDREMRVIREA